MVKVPCGRTLGHGEACVAGYLCEQCAEIERLRAELAAERERCARVAETYDAEWLDADKVPARVAAAIRRGEP